MTRHKRHMAVLALMVSLTVTGPLYAVTPKKIDASRSCANQQNGEISMAWIFCLESQRNKQVFSKIFTGTENVNSDSNSDSEPNPKKPAEHAINEPQPSVKPPKEPKAVKDEAHRHGSDHFPANQRPHSRSTSKGSKIRKSHGGRNPNGRQAQRHRHHPVLVNQGKEPPRKPRVRRIRTVRLATAEVRALIHQGIPLRI